MKHNLTNPVIKCTAVALLLALPLTASAQYRKAARRADNYHFGYVSAMGGYGSLNENVEGLTTQGGASAAIGVGYEFRRTSFWLSVGAQIQANQSKSVLNQYTFSPNLKNRIQTGIDGAGNPVYQKVGNEYVYYDGLTSAGKPAKFSYVINQTDNQVMHFVDVPIMLGYYYHGFYVGAGAKVGFAALYNKAKVNAEYEFSASPVNYIGDFSKMHEFTKGTSQTEKDLTLKPRWSVIGEIGYDVLASVPNRNVLCQVLKVGFYFEMGLNNIIEPGTMNKVEFTHLDAQGHPRADMPQVNPYYTTAIPESDYVGSHLRVLPYTVGLKLTYLIGGSPTGGSGTWHRGCQCYE